jgi:hypothetical protein
MFLRRLASVVFDPENGAGAGVAAPQTNGHAPSVAQIASEELAKVNGAQQPVQPAAPTQQQPVVPAGPSLRDAFAAQGYDVSGFESDDALKQAIDGSLTRAQQFEQVSPWLAYADEINEFVASKAKPQTPAQQPEAKPEAPTRRYSPPHQIDERFSKLLEVDETTGLYRAPDSAPFLAQVARQANENAAYDQQFWGKFRQDPDAWLEESPVFSKREKALMERIEKIEAYYQSQLQAEAQTQAQQLADKYAAVIFQVGADGKPDTTKQTPMGALVSRYYDDMTKAGKPEREVLQSIEQMLTQHAPPPPAPAQPAAPATPRGPDGRFQSPAQQPPQQQQGWLRNGLNRLPNASNRVVQSNGTQHSASEAQLPQRPGLRGPELFNAIAQEEMQNQGVS